MAIGSRLSSLSRQHTGMPHTPYKLAAAACGVVHERNRVLVVSRLDIVVGVSKAIGSSEVAVSHGSEMVYLSAGFGVEIPHLNWIRTDHAVKEAAGKELKDALGPRT